MKAPYKLYIDDLAVVNDCSTKVSLESLPNFSEYIRKDYLLEWAKEEIERKKSELPNLVAEGLIKAYIKVVNKLSEL